MPSHTNKSSKQALVMKLAAAARLSIVLALGTFAGAAGAGWDDRDQRPAHRDAGRHDDRPRGDRDGGYRRAPPVVYDGPRRGSGYYAPPVVYGPQPGIGIVLPRAVIRIR